MPRVSRWEHFKNFFVCQMRGNTWLCPHMCLGQTNCLISCFHDASQQSSRKSATLQEHHTRDGAVCLQKLWGSTCGSRFGVVMKIYKARTQKATKSLCTLQVGVSRPCVSSFAFVIAHDQQYLFVSKAANHKACPV